MLINLFIFICKAIVGAGIGTIMVLAVLAMLTVIQTITGIGLASAWLTSGIGGLLSVAIYVICIAKIVRK